MKCKSHYEQRCQEVDIMNMAYQEGMVDLRRAGHESHTEGLTSLEEVTAHYQ